jgi:hypothetical protein
VSRSARQEDMAEERFQHLREIRTMEPPVESDPAGAPAAHH